MLEFILVLAIAGAAIYGVRLDAKRIHRKLHEQPEFWVLSLATLILLAILWVTGFPTFTSEPSNTHWLK